MTKRLSTDPTGFENFCDVYENNPLMPFVASALQLTGLGAVDRLLSKRSNDFAIRKINALIKELDSRINKAVASPQSDDFVAGVNMAVNSLLESNGHEKVKYFGIVLSSAWNEEKSSWDEISQALRIIKDLEDVHFKILKWAYDLRGSKKYEPYFLLESQDRKDEKYKNILNAFPSLDALLIESCNSDLIAKGLMNDTNFRTADSKFYQTEPDADIAFNLSNLGLCFVNKVHEMNGNV